jgi:hypothetical protein
MTSAQLVLFEELRVRSNRDPLRLRLDQARYDVVRILLTMVSSQLAPDRKRFTEWPSSGIVEFISYTLAAKSATPPILSTLLTGGKDAFNASAFSMNAPWIIYSRIHFPGRSERRREGQSGSYPFSHVPLPLCYFSRLDSDQAKPQGSASLSSYSQYFE